MAAGEVRIIGGKWRGRKLRFDAEPGLRPTLARVRETLGNWLRPHWADARVLDLFAGTGALGLEALSLGAAHVTFVDRSKRSTARIRRHLETLDAPSNRVEASTRIECLRADRFLARCAAQSPAPCWDIIFLDPPFGGDQLLPILEQIRSGPCLAEGGFVYVETQRRGADALFETLTAWHVHRRSAAADVAFALLTRLQTNA